MPVPRLKEPTLSIRLLWPFARIIGADYFQAPELMAATGITLSQFGDPETRLPHGVVMRALESAIQLTGDPTLGLRAGQIVDHGELDFVEYAARSEKTLGESIRVMARFLHILDEAADIALVPEGEFVLWRARPVRGASYPPAANDYLVALALAFSQRNASSYTPPVEVRFMHEAPSYAAEYERYFESRIVFGAPHNGALLHASRLEVPMLRANAGVAKAFELQATRALEKLRVKEGVSGSVREALTFTLREGAPSMQATARRLAMAVATLRRKLDAEGTTFTGLVDEVRKELAFRHLSSTDATVSEVAFLLGFSDVRAFGRAFRRWYGVSPTEHRAAQQRPA